MIAELISSEHVEALVGATPRVFASVCAFLSIHIYEDLTMAAKKLSSAESVHLELESVNLLALIEANGMPFNSCASQEMHNKVSFLLVQS